MALAVSVGANASFHVVVRPLVYVSEAEARAYCQEMQLPVIGCCCSACGDLSLKRQRIKRMITEFEVEHPDVKQSMIAALGRVMPRHLLDRRLAAFQDPEEGKVDPTAVPVRFGAPVTF